MHRREVYIAAVRTRSDRFSFESWLVQAASTTDVQEKLESHPSSSAMPPFHLAFPVNDLEETKSFYGR